MKTLTNATTTRTVAELLTEARESAKLDIASAAEKTRIPERYLWLLERGDYDELADDVYTKIYLKAYCASLHLDVAKMLGLYHEERTVRESMSSNRRRHPTRAIPAAQLVVAPKVIRAGAATVLALAILGYFAFQVAAIVTPPPVSIATPQEGAIVRERSIVIEGRTEQEVLLHINGKPVPTDGTGGFRDTIDLREGVNVITVTAAKKHSKPITVTRHVIVEAREALPSPDAADQGALME